MEEKICVVKNRSAGVVVYNIPELGVRRTFAAGETKRVPYRELVALSYQSGGTVLLRQFLQVTDTKAISELAINPEPEYYMNENQIIELIKTGSLDAFLDCLDFAPVGVIDLIKTFSVTIPLSDYEKRKALKEKTGFDVDAALRNLEAEKAESKAAAEPIARRIEAAPKTEEKTEAAPTRRTSGSNYKVVSKAE
jgi:hypothetical protein